jgi:uncharacterized protein YpuA (DUF1002 family)
MNTQDQIWITQNRIHELKLNIASEYNVDYKKYYEELTFLEKKLKELYIQDECDRQS